MTPTPRTDAECYDCEYRGDLGGRFTADRGKHDPYGENVSADFARQLERENAELLNALEKCLYIIEDPADDCMTLWRTDDEVKDAYDAAVAAIAKTKGKL